MGPASIRPDWVPYCMRSCPHGLGGVLHANLHDWARLQCELLRSVLVHSLLNVD